MPPKRPSTTKQSPMKSKKRLSDTPQSHSTRLSGVDVLSTDESQSILSSLESRRSFSKTSSKSAVNVDAKTQPVDDYSESGETSSDDTNVIRSSSKPSSSSTESPFTLGDIKHLFDSSINQLRTKFNRLCLLKLKFTSRLHHVY